MNSFTFLFLLNTHILQDIVFLPYIMNREQSLQPRQSKADEVFKSSKETVSDLRYLPLNFCQRRYREMIVIYDIHFLLYVCVDNGSPYYFRNFQCLRINGSSYFCQSSVFLYLLVETC